MNKLPSYNPNLEVKKSLIPNANLGLFAKCSIPKNSFIDVYFGKVMTNGELKKLEDRFPKRDFRTYNLWDDILEKNIISFHRSDCYARFVNDVSLQGKACNAKFDSFKFKKENSKENSKTNCLTFLPLPQRSATMCIRAACHINKGDEIYIAYGSDYWDSDTKAKYQLEKNKFKRMTCLIKKKIINKYNYIQKTSKKTSKVKKELELESIEIPVCPSSSLSSSMKTTKTTPFVWAGWSPSTKIARTNGLLEYDKSRRKWLILKKDTHPLPYPTTRYLYHQSIVSN